MDLTITNELLNQINQNGQTVTNSVYGIQDSLNSINNGINGIFVIMAFFMIWGCLYWFRKR